jgi:hypothetical protein
MARIVAPAVTALLLALAACGREHVEANAFTWTGSVPAGGWLHLRNLQGRITVDSSPSADVAVTATLRWRGHRGDVSFERRALGNGMIICSMYGKGGVCDTSGYAPSPHRGGSNFVGLHMNGGNASVDYLVHIPPGVKVDVSTVAGQVLVSGATSAVTAHTVDGSVGVQTASGPVDLRTVNGSVKASVATLLGSDAIRIETVNGSVRAQLPAAVQGAFDLENVNGSIRSDFPLGASGSEHHHLTGTIGTGGGSVQLKTVNGSVTLTKGT